MTAKCQLIFLFLFEGTLITWSSECYASLGGWKPFPTMDRIWRYATTCEGLFSSVCCWCFSACVPGYAHAPPKEKLLALPVMRHDVPPACQPPMPRAASRVTCRSVPHTQHGHACCTWPWDVTFPHSLRLFLQVCCPAQGCESHPEVSCG